MFRHVTGASVFVLLLVVRPTPLHAAQPQSVPKQDSESVDAIRKAAMRAEVRGVWVYEPLAYEFSHKDVTNWPQMVDLLRRKEGPAGRVRELLSKRAHDLLADDALVGQVGAESPTSEVFRLKSEVATGMRKLLDRPDFYTEKAFKGVPLDKGMKDMLARGEKRTYLQTLHVNRALLALAFPEVVRQVPTDYHTVRVLVKPGKPVVLVLSSYRACQWHVEVEKGGEVVGVILCGSESQEVTGVKVPVVYRAGRDPYGKEREGEVVGIVSYEKVDKSLRLMEDKIKQITGKPVAKFQGQYTAPKEGFVVKPDAK